MEIKPEHNVYDPRFQVTYRRCSKCKNIEGVMGRYIFKDDYVCDWCICKEVIRKKEGSKIEY